MASRLTRYASALSKTRHSDGARRISSGSLASQIACCIKERDAVGAIVVAFTTRMFVGIRLYVK